MAIIRLSDVVFNLGATPILSGAALSIQANERLALIGRNGMGKSTFMKLLNGAFEPESGQIEFMKGIKTAYLQQEVPQDMSGPIEDIMLEGLGEQVRDLLAFHKVSKIVAEDPSEENLDKLSKLQQRIDAANGWQHQLEVDKWCSMLEIPSNTDFSTLSGGLKRRVLLGKALISKPDLLMLDEPTNHMDIRSIRWMENFLLSQNVSLLFVTHDRSFLDKVATSIIELDRGIIRRYPSPYDKYLEKKEEDLENEAKEFERFDKKLAEEERWIRRGLEARRTRNMGRVRDLQKMREERQSRRDRTGQVNMKIDHGDKSGALVFEVKNVDFSWGDHKIISDFNTIISRGDKVGIIGANGSGKSTMIKLLLQDLQPSSGTIRVGTKLEIAYFDQMRMQLAEEKTAREVVFDGHEYETINGSRKHVLGYLRNFLFTEDRAQTPIKVLSGGERNRLLLAKLFSKPANLLVLDEPTNDLDMETLELLEEILLEFSGTILLVSHDRTFLSNVCTNYLVLDGSSEVKEYIGGFDNWDELFADAEKENKAAVKKENKPKKKKKLSYKEQKELTALPGKIEELEALKDDLYLKLADPELYKKPTSEHSKLQEEVDQTEAKLAEAYERWEALEMLKEELENE